MQFKKYLFISSLILASCQPLVNSRGNVVAERQVDSFVIGRTTMSDVLQACGTPSLHKNNFTWIYMGGKSEEVSFKKVKMANRVVIKLVFDENQILREKIVTHPTGDNYSFNEEVTDLISNKEAVSLLKNNHE